MKVLHEVGFDQFAKMIEDSGRSPATVKAYRSDAAQFVAWAGERNEPVSGKSATFWLSEFRASLSAQTTRRRAVSVNQYLTWLGRDTSDLEAYKLPVPKRTTPHPLKGGMDDVRAMMSETEIAEKAALVVLQGFGGLRVSEARSVSVDDIDFEQGIIPIRGKGDKERVIMFDPKGVAFGVLIERAAEVGEGLLVQLSDRQARETIAVLAKRAGVSAHGKASVSSHDLRATAATALYFASGCDIRLVQDFLGHSSVSQTEIYVKSSPERLAAAVTAL